MVLQYLYSTNETYQCGLRLKSETKPTSVNVCIRHKYARVIQTIYARDMLLARSGIPVNRTVRQLGEASCTSLYVRRGLGIYSGAAAKEAAAPTAS